MDNPRSGLLKAKPSRLMEFLQPYIDSFQSEASQGLLRPPAGEVAGDVADMLKMAIPGGAPQRFVDPAPTVGRAAGLLGERLGLLDEGEQKGARFGRDLSLSMGPLGTEFAPMAALPPGAATTPGRLVMSGGKKPPIPPRGTGGLLGTSTAKETEGLRDLRDLPVDEAIKIAASEPHLKPKKGGGFIGGPPGIKTKKDLLRKRRELDKMIDDDPRGRDWYERNRAGTAEVTGGDPRAGTSVAQRQAMFSASRDPAFELQSGLKEGNASIMGMPARANFGTQHQKHLAAIEENDPLLYTSGNKVGIYGGMNDPHQPVKGAVGTNDFRAANILGYDVKAGTAKTALREPEHRFADHEYALAVKRARDREAGGFKDWSGGHVQAAPWVVDKTRSLVERRNLVAKHIKAGNSRRKATKLAYDEAFAEANKVPADFFPKHTANMTHEAQPGAATGQLPGSVGAPAAERAAYAADPRAGWGTAPGGRDALYAGLQAHSPVPPKPIPSDVSPLPQKPPAMSTIPGQGLLGSKVVHPTGVAAQVRPTLPMTGVYEGSAGLEMNPGWVGRPLVSVAKTPKRGRKIGKADRAMLRGAEVLRAAVDAQEAGAGHMVFRGEPIKRSRSASLLTNRALTPEELLGVKETAKRHGLLDVADTGDSITITNFDKSKLRKPVSKQGLLDIQAAVPSDARVGDAQRVKVEGIYESLADKWKEGSGAVTREVLKHLNVTPEARTAWDNHPHLAERALSRVSLDKDWTKWGLGRKDLEKFRKIIGTGKGWIRRMEKEVRERPETLPAFIGILGGLNALGGETKKQ